MPIATGAAMAARYEGTDRVVCCFVGDGAFANGVVLESLNWASQHQWTNHLAGERAYGLPVIYFIQNNHYGMTHRTDEEVMGVRHLARRGAGLRRGQHARRSRERHGRPRRPRRDPARGRSLPRR